MNCWYTMATLRSRTGTPCHVGAVGPHGLLARAVSPAMIRISEVLPAWVAPSSTVMAPGSGARLIGCEQDL